MTAILPSDEWFVVRHSVAKKSDSVLATHSLDCVPVDLSVVGTRLHDLPPHRTGPSQSSRGNCLCCDLSPGIFSENPVGYRVLKGIGVSCPTRETWLCIFSAAKHSVHRNPYAASLAISQRTVLLVNIAVNGRSAR